MDKQYLLFAVKVFLRGLLYTFIIFFVFMAAGILFFMLMRYSTEQLLEFKKVGYPYQQQVNIIAGIVFAFIPHYYAFRRTFLNDSKKFKIDLLLSIKYCVVFILILDVVLRFGTLNLGFTSIYAIMYFIAGIAITIAAYYLAGTRAAENISKT